MVLKVFSSIFFGILAFFSPCVFPLIPGIVAYVSGVSYEELNEQKGKIFLTMLFFVLGFSFIFTLLGAGATTIGSFLAQNIDWLNKIGGIIIILFGLHFIGQMEYMIKTENKFLKLFLKFLGLFRIKFLASASRVNIKSDRRNKTGIGRYIGAFLFGMALAPSWTACTGPYLGSLLMLAAQEKTVLQGMVLLFFYSMGLGIPFIVISLFINLFFKILRRWGKYLGWVEIFGGVILIVFGILMFSGRLYEFMYGGF